ncbi:T9SS type A sorting domain-containing protein [Segatella hominis]|uniref:T9SS type A sorting domain-containing protein n=1 Tax=Segatella hominis TaxID=2518605 RepID=A0A4Y8ULT8_9BACT|nr:T9SS type A sorting domain-containing protein [Segatella hominis]
MSNFVKRLPTGIYLCRYSNATEIKTVKIIKQ